MDPKIRAYLDDMRNRGIRKFTAAPPLWRFFWWLGWPIRPPLFWGFWELFLLSGFCFTAGIFPVFLCIEKFRNHPLPLWAIGIVCAIGGTFFGICMAAIFRIRAKRIGFEYSWEEYRP